MRLVLDDDSGIPLPLNDVVREAWLLQYNRAAHMGAIEGFRERLASCFATSLAECLDTDCWRALKIDQESGVLLAEN
jgi:hypothetical protein